MPDFIPRPDSECLSWMRNFTGRIYESPETFGATPEIAQELHDRFDEFAEALQIASAPGTRTKPSVTGKDTARKRLERVARSVAGVARAKFMQDRGKLIPLGLVRGPGRNGRRSKLPAPKARPMMAVISVQGSTVSFSLRDPEAPYRRRVARGVQGANVFSFIGNTPPPTDSRRWAFNGMISRNNGKLSFGTTHPPGTKVWICARWIGTRGDSGPTGEPVYAHLGYGNTRPQLGERMFGGATIVAS